MHYSWGNTVYADLSVNETFSHHGRAVTLKALQNNFCCVSVDGQPAELPVARRSLPETINGVRVFIADNRNVKGLTTDQDTLHALCAKDALVCLSDPTQPLLDPARYCFPVSRDDGFTWSMRENSHQFAYLGEAAYMAPGYYRSHEGIDLDLHKARGAERHALVAIEHGTIRWIDTSDPGGHEACILLESGSRPGIFYVYQHINRDKIFVTAGEAVVPGQRLGYIWGDWQWGHLHFAAVVASATPTYEHRYDNTLNCFPQLYELWHGGCRPRPRVWASRHFTFDRQYWTCGNAKCLEAYDEVVGYGWLLGTWCAAGMVERKQPEAALPLPQNARLRKVLHEGTWAAAANPLDYYDFIINVENGTYLVRVRVGDCLAPSWQRVAVNGTDLGTYLLPANIFAWTPEHTAVVTNNKLTVRLHLKDNGMYAGLSELVFQNIPAEQEPLS